jgi:hypothetical protein
MSSYHTICSNALHQTDYRPTPPASLLPKLLHHQLPYYTSYYATSFPIIQATTPTPLSVQPFPMLTLPCSHLVHASSTCSHKQPMSLPSVTPLSSNVCPTPCYAAYSAYHVPLRTAAISLSFPYGTTLLPPVLLCQEQHLPVCPSPTTQPQKPRVLCDLVNEPTIRCPLCVDITYYPPLSNIRISSQ